MSKHNCDPKPLPVTILEDAPVHVGPYPFCTDPGCPYYEESAQQVEEEYQAGLLTPEEADRLVQRWQLAARRP